ncbi:MAG TPA: surface-adhesin E family protein [Flavobacterium sp.]
MSKKIFVIAAMDDEKIHSVKYDSQNLSGIRFWWNASFTYKRVKNKKGEWIDYKKKDYSMTLININCEKREFEVLKVIDYDGNEKVIKNLNGNGTTEYIVPNSLMETFSTIICN